MPVDDEPFALLRQGLYGYVQRASDLATLEQDLRAAVDRREFAPIWQMGEPDEWLACLDGYFESDHAPDSALLALAISLVVLLETERSTADILSPDAAQSCAFAWHLTGDAWGLIDNHERVAGAHGRAAAQYRRAGNDLEAARSTVRQARSLQQAGMLDEALRLYEQVATEFGPAHDFDQAYTRLNQATCLEARGELSTALQTYEEVAEDFHRAGYRNSARRAECHQAGCLRALSRNQEAIELYINALQDAAATWNRTEPIPRSPVRVPYRWRARIIIQARLEKPAWREVAADHPLRDWLGDPVLESVLIEALAQRLQHLASLDPRFAVGAEIGHRRVQEQQVDMGDRVYSELLTLLLLLGAPTDYNRAESELRAYRIHCIRTVGLTRVVRPAYADLEMWALRRGIQLNQLIDLCIEKPITPALNFWLRKRQSPSKLAAWLRDEWAQQMVAVRIKQLRAGILP